MVLWLEPTPPRAPWIRCGALLMLSRPPATTTRLVPATMLSWAKIAACIPLPQALLTVTAPAASGMPAPMAACRAGHCFSPAGSTQPMNTSSTSAPPMPLRSRVARIAVLASSVAGTGANAPSRPPMGVRAPSTITTESLLIVLLHPSRPDRGVCRVS